MSLTSGFALGLVLVASCLLVMTTVCCIKQTGIIQAALFLLVMGLYVWIIAMTKFEIGFNNTDNILVSVTVIVGIVSTVAALLSWCYQRGERPVIYRKGNMIYRRVQHEEYLEKHERKVYPPDDPALVAQLEHRICSLVMLDNAYAAFRLPDGLNRRVYNSSLFALKNSADKFVDVNTPNIDKPSVKHTLHNYIDKLLDTIQEIRIDIQKASVTHVHVDADDLINRILDVNNMRGDDEMVEKFVDELIVTIYPHHSDYDVA